MYNNNNGTFLDNNDSYVSIILKKSDFYSQCL